MMRSGKIRLGTRGSPLALRQAEMVRAALARVSPRIETELVIIKTSGDWRMEQGETPLPEGAGGKALFAKEIEEALLRGEIDAGAHSMKDMDSRLPEGLVINHMLRREDARDALVFCDKAAAYKKLADLPRGMTIGSCSPRRVAMLRSIRPDLNIVPLRGNVQTRIDKLRRREQGMDAILLACAGLKRLGLESEIGLTLEPEEILPAAGQGAVGIEMRREDCERLSIFDQISCPDTVMRVKAERAALAAMEGSCRTPIGAYATLENDMLRLRMAFFEQIHSKMHFEEISERATDIDAAEAIGARAGQNLRIKSSNFAIPGPKDRVSGLVLLTRPLESSLKLASEIEKRGIPALIEPMLRIKPVECVAPDMSRYDGVIFTSAYAPRYFSGDASLPAFCVGNATAYAAQKAGFRKIFSAGNGASGLLDFIKEQEKKRYLYVSGAQIARDIAPDLEKAGCEIDRLIVYKADLTENLSEDCRAALKEGRIQAAAFFSRRTAENFVRLVEKNDLSRHLEPIKLLSISDAVIKSVRFCAWKNAYAAKRPDREAVLDLIFRECGQTTRKV